MTAVAPIARMLNLGCGRRLHAAWINVDIAPQHPDVLRWDVSAGLPYPDRHFDAVYHSHVIEHIRRAEAGRFLHECRRVLKPGGILRIATPDLERLCELYLQKLRAGDDADREWLVLEMFDQTVRERTGGAMLDYLRQQPVPNESFVLERIGEEGRELMAAVRPAERIVPAARRSLIQRAVARLISTLARAREALLKKLYGDDAMTALAIGTFRMSGEVHHWMYDRTSLRQLLLSVGFCEPAVRQAGDSVIPGWQAFFLEVTESGAVIKPDSLFIEARNPA